MDIFWIEIGDRCNARETETRPNLNEPNETSRGCVRLKFYDVQPDYKKKKKIPVVGTAGGRITCVFFHLFLTPRVYSSRDNGACAKRHVNQPRRHGTDTACTLNAQ